MKLLLGGIYSHWRFTPLRCLCGGGKERENAVVFSGIQPTGVLHLGNYFGAVNRWLDFQKSDETSLIISVVDFHAITTGLKTREELKKDILDMTASLLACGMDPEKCTLFQQSAVPHHTQLSWIFCCLSTLAQLNRMPQYKDKAKGYREGDIPVALLTYPLLQAADILLYKATHVPIGEDQSQHMHIAHRIARHINSRYGIQYFPLPKPVVGCFGRIRNLRYPEKKMSKSDPDRIGRIEISDSADEIRNKIKKAVTDMVGGVTYEPVKRPGVANLLDLYSAVCNETPDSICRSAASLNTAQFKVMVADKVIEKFAPITQKYYQLRKQPDFLEGILKDGSDKAESIAEKHMKEIKEIIGFS